MTLLLSDPLFYQLKAKLMKTSRSFKKLIKIYKVAGLNGETGVNAIMNVPLRTETGKDPELNDKPEKQKSRNKFA